MQRRFNEEQRYALWLAADGKCERCGKELPENWHADHVFPHARGGPTDVLNGQALCPECNIKKGISFQMNPLPFEEKLTFHYPSERAPRRWHHPCRKAFFDKLETHTEGTFTFLVHSAVGSGKTYLAAMLAAEMLNRKLIRRVVYVCPNQAIKRAVRRTFSDFGIELVDWNNRRDAHGEPLFYRGGVMTYQSLAKRPEIQRRLCRVPTLVIFDEIHHLGDSQSWDLAAREAFGGANVAILGLSGTPYRTDNREIPFVSYEPMESGLQKFRADFTYSLAEGICDGYNKKPFFQWLDADILLSVNGCERTHSFYSDVSEETANLLLNGAVKLGAASRIDALQQAVIRCREENRKLIIFVGGDSNADTRAIEDAETNLPAEITSLDLDIPVRPEEIVSITSSSPDSVRKLEEFGKSSAWILISVNMVSEGVDIPELSAALFLTSITAKATTIQRIGRILRGRGTALIFLFRDRRYVEFSTEIEQAIEREFRARRQRPEIGEDVCYDPERRRHIEAVGIAARLDGVTFNNKVYSQADVDAARAWVIQRGLPNLEEWIGMALEARQGR